MPTKRQPERHREEVAAGDWMGNMTTFWIVATMMMSAKAAKPVKVCEPTIHVSPKITTASPYTPAVITAYVRMAAVDERCYCPEVEFLVLPSGSYEHSFREVHEADCDPWLDQPKIQGGEYWPATPRGAWSWRPANEGRFGMFPGEWTFTAKLKQGAWKQSVTVSVTVVG
jgi:hypothetical protein